MHSSEEPYDDTQWKETQPLQPIYTVERNPVIASNVTTHSFDTVIQRTILLHTGVKLHVFKVCGKSLNNSINLKSHIGMVVSNVTNNLVHLFT